MIRPLSAVRVVVGLLTLATVACQERSFVGPRMDASDRGGPSQDAGLPDGFGMLPPPTDAAPRTDGPCTQITCAVAGGPYCGKIGDGCGGALDCGDCPTGLSCGIVAPHVCARAAAACAPLKCELPGGRLCGKVGDGCGHPLDCAGCPNGQSCGAAGVAGVCAPAPGCQPLTRERPGGRLCGKIGDGCGHLLDCGDCSNGLVCGGSGIPGVCGPSSMACQSLVCKPAGGQYCGKIGDTCGHELNCGDCPSGQS